MTDALEQFRVYIAGPMRGILRWNFPAFDAARDYLKDKGYNVVSPADLDRQAHGKDVEYQTDLPPGFVREALARDFAALATCDAIYMLNGWENSAGARAELAFAQAIGMRVMGDEPWTVPVVKKSLTTAHVNPRKARPVARGVLDYFPDAILEIAHVSYTANEQHNPGEPMHWAKEKSTDHADCIVRHLIDRGTLDDDGLRHTAKVAWRALALLQTELEAEKKAAA